MSMKTKHKIIFDDSKNMEIIPKKLETVNREP